MGSELPPLQNSEPVHKKGVGDPATFLTLFIFITHFLLVFYDFFPNLSEINFWDEALYVNWGRFLVEGRLPSFAQNPLLSLFYALLYIPFSRSPYWLVQICSLGRVLFFCLIWLGAFLSARELKRVLSLPLFAGLLLVLPVTTEVLGNPSDALFTAMAGFALWQVLAYRNSQQLKNLLLASLFVGLAALARNDGFVLFAIFMFLSVILSLGSGSALKKIALSPLPFLGFVGGYLLLSGLVTGNFSSGTLQRSYLAFEQGHEGVYEGSGIHSNTISAMLDAREKFGTPEENNYSVFRAIQRNPAAYLARLRLILTRLPEQLLTVYNKKIAAVLFLGFIWGVVTLLRKKDFHTLVILLVWPAYLLTYFLTFFREGYLRTPFLVICLLSTIGFSALFQWLDRRVMRWGATGGLIMLVLSGLLFNKLAVFYGAFLFLAGMWGVIWIRKRFADTPNIFSLSLVVMLVVGLVLHGNYASPRIQVLGKNADEQAAVYLNQNFPPGTKVGAGSPGVVWMAKQEFTAITGADVPAFDTSVDFHRWLLNEGIQVIYLDYSISNHAPYFWELIQQETGHGLTEVFSENAGSNRIYIVEDERQ